MKYLIFTIYDRVTGTYSAPFLSVNVGAAVRQFDYAMEHTQMVAQDSELYQLGEFNSDTGLISVSDKPVFVKKFEVL